jgi:predicted ATPase
VEIGTFVADLRKRNGWTQEVLAEKSGISVRTIRNVECGSIKNPRQASVDLILSVLDPHGCSLDAFHGFPATCQWRGPRPPELPLFGRGRDLDRLTQSVHTRRLTVLSGPGGVGKTRLALEAAQKAHHIFRNGVAVVELGGLAPEPASGRTGPVNPVLSRVLDHLTAVGDGDRGIHLLMVLDNAEHVPTAAASAVKEVLSGFPGLHIILTTRRRIIDPVPYDQEVAPLPVDPSGHPWDAPPPAVELLMNRLSVELASRTALIRDTAGLTDICRRLDGIPRAIEFAAERLRSIPLSSLLRSDAPLSVYRSSGHTSLPHQRSLAASVKWSVDLLTNDQRWLLVRLSALPTGTFSLDDLTALSDAPGLPPQDSVLGLLADLVDHSLVTVTRATHGRYDYRLGPDVREYAVMLGGTPSGLAPTGPSSTSASV